MMSSQGFDPKDLEDICSKKPTKFKMKKADFKELGRNIMLGSVDVAIGCVQATALIASQIPTRNSDVIRSIDGLKKELRDRDDRAWKRNNYIDPTDNSNN